MRAKVSVTLQSRGGSSTRVLAALLVLMTLGTAARADTTTLPESAFPGVSAQALRAYRQGWVEILEYGRWTEAERLYRRAIALDPQFTLGKSVLARITADSAERDRLYAEVEAQLPKTNADIKLLLHTYQRTLELFAAREDGVALPASDRRQMAQRAVDDYAAFLEKYPHEWSVMIEYVEWVHALQGPAVAIATVEGLMQSSDDDSLSFSYFPAELYAELGDFDRARELASVFTQRQSGSDFPQPHFIKALIYFHEGSMESAKIAVEAALDRDPKHILAQRLRSKIHGVLAEP